MADPRYQSKQHSTSKRPIISGRNSSFYRDDENEEIEEAQEKYDYDMDEDDEDQDQEDDQNHRYSYRRRDTQPQQQQQQQQQQETDDDDDDDDGEDEELDRQPKKRKLKSLMEYELAPRSNSQPGGSNVRNSSTTEWSERETFALLEAWGNRYLELGRKSIRSEDWVEVAEKVSEVSKTERLDTQCRNRLDTLKKKYKKEKAKINENGGGGGGSRWVYFKKMDMLMALSPKQECGLACGVDSGEYVFMNPKVYLNCANGFDEMRDSPANSESFVGNEDSDEDDDGDDEERSSSSVRMLAESIQKFSTIYEKIENSKRQQMMELEKMRQDFHNDLELQNKQLLERVQTEIEKIHKDNNDDDDNDNGDGDNGGDDDDDNDDSDDASAENLSV